jgi:hypothetical protein
MQITKFMSIYVQFDALAGACANSAAGAAAASRYAALAQLMQATREQQGSLLTASFGGLDDTAAAAMRPAALLRLPLEAMPLLRTSFLAGLQPHQLCALSPTQLALLLPGQVCSATAFNPLYSVLLVHRIAWPAPMCPCFGVPAQLMA